MNKTHTTNIFKGLIAAGTLTLGAIFALSMAAGCQSLDLSPSEEVALEAAVKTGTLLFMDKHPETAAEAIAATRKVYAVIESGEVDLVKVKEIVESMIDFDSLSEQEAAALNLAIDFISSQIQAEEIDSDKIVKLSRILLWINEAALMAGAGAA